MELLEHNKHIRRCNAKTAKLEEEGSRLKKPLKKTNDNVALSPGKDETKHHPCEDNQGVYNARYQDPFLCLRADIDSGLWYIP